MNNRLPEALLANAPHPSLGEHADTYGRLIGSWIGEARNHTPDGPAQSASIEVHFSWALDGRAVLDAWITPARNDRASGQTARMHWFGTTLRVFDPATESWRATWWDPESAVRCDLQGFRQGDDIVQIGRHGDRTIRWTFSRIVRDSLLWQGHVLEHDGATWRLEAEVRLRRSPG
jgi:hypothetical protein